MAKKIIFHLISHFSVGGAQKVAFNIAKSNHSDIEHHIITVYKDKQHSEYARLLKQELSSNNIRFRDSSFYGSKLSILLFPFWFLSLVNKLKPAIIHSHTEIPDMALYSFMNLFGRLFSGIQYVRTIHNTVLWSGWQKLGQKVEKNFYKKGVINITISNSVDSHFKDFLSTIPLSNQQTKLIFNGLEVKTGAKKFESLKLGKRNLLFAGRFEPQKGIKALCDIIIAMNKHNAVFFHLIGDGSMKQFMEDQLKDCNNYTIYPPYHGLDLVLNSFDYLIMPSLHEGLPLLTIESLFCKTPVIANNIPGLNETLPPNYPYLVERNNLQKYIDLLLASFDEQEYQKIAEEGKQFVSEKFSLAKMQDEYYKIYLKS